MSILKTLRDLDETRHDDVEAWLAQKRREAAPHITTSVDLRHSGLRLAPVDTNLFPAGFNNLSPAASARAARFLKRFLEEHHPKAKRVLIVPENHTRNLAYLDNLAALLSIFSKAGVEAKLGSLAAAAPLALTSRSGEAIAQYPLVRANGQLTLEDGFTPDLIVMNNDMTSGPPPILENITQPVIPPVSLGWWQRHKSTHFAAYAELAKEFAAAFSLDPWLIAAEFHCCGRVDFKENAGLDCVAAGVEKVLARAREKHKQYGIAEDPYVFIKADSGTYGMGIMTARSGEEVLNPNKKTRNKMQVVKEGAQVHEVIIQEGIQTADRVNEKPAEPLIYMIDGVPVGGMWRYNNERDAYGNLNASGMDFTGMCDEGEDECGKWKSVVGCDFRSFGLIAALAALAAAREKYGSTVMPEKVCC